MPRKETYWKNPKKYRKQAREDYRKKCSRKLGHSTFGKSYISSGISISGTSKVIGLDKLEPILLKYYSKRHVSRKIKAMESLGQLYFCEGYAFMPLSIFLQSYSNKQFSTVSSTSVKGEEGILGFIPFIQSCYPIVEGYMIYTNPISQHGIDFLITKNGVPYTVIEVTNYGQDSFIHSREVNRYIKNLNEWSKKYSNIFKVIVIRFPENLKAKNSKISSRYKNAYVKFVKNQIGIKVMR